MEEINYPEWVKPDIQFKVDFGSNHPCTKVYHIRALVDNEVVLCYWLKRKGYWQYECVSEFWFDAYKEKIKNIKKDVDFKS